MVLSEEYVTLKVGDSKTIKAQLKPDWTEIRATFKWEPKDQGLVTLSPVDDSSISIKAIKPGATIIQVKDQGSGKTKEVKIRVTE
ncbi:hypothetical protein NSQ82_14690 [Caldifermentibacillus hisashii]|uniref:hypothetical protein n=1 Tax=Caldifermentibacillus hisashii TaxID=996558 RepID=UPI001F3EABEE|nr:hypothetical protein [Caldifermentibacillus hisashii]